MQRERITKLLLERIQPGPKDVVVWDQEVKGFGLKVTPKGRRVYFAFYRTLAGQQRKPTIGVHGKVTAENARQIAKKWIAGALVGQDVSAERKEARTTINSLRHTSASWSVMGGLSLPQTGALLGHKSAQTTLRYADHLTQAIRGYSQLTANIIAAE